MDDNLVSTTILLMMMYGQSSQHCDVGWIGYGGSCYLFQTYHCAFSEAETLCIQHRGHLTSVHNLDEVNFLKSEIQTVFTDFTGVEYNTFWIGYNAQGGWTDGSDVDFIGWNNNQSSSSLERSEFISIGRRWAIETDPKVLRYYICKKQADRGCPSYCPRLSVYNHCSGHCYRFVGKNVTWKEAELACANMATNNTSGYLVTIDNYKEAMFLSAFPSRLIKSRYIWAKYRNVGSNGEWNSHNCTKQTQHIQHGMHNNVYNGRHRLCSVTDILLKTRSVGICHDTKPALCEFEPFEPDKRKTSNVRSCSDTSSSTSFSTTQTSLQHLLNVGKGVSESSAVTQDHNSEERLKRRVIALEQNQTTDLSKVISKTNRTDHKTSETYLNHSINDMKSNNESNNSDANFHISFLNSTEVNKYENNSTIPSGVTPNTVHVVIGILGIIVFVILICGLFINDLKSMTLHIVRGEEGRANRENHALYHPRLTVHANYQNELSSTQTLSQSRDRLSFKD